MAKIQTITEADILSELIAPDEADWNPLLAQAMLALQFGDDARQRMRELMDRNNKGVITEAEIAELDKYLRVGTFVDLIQAKARLSLHRHRMPQN